MRLHDRIKGTRVAIRENVLVYDHKKVNTYDLIISIGKGKRRAMMLKVAIESVLRVALAAEAQ